MKGSISSLIGLILVLVVILFINIYLYLKLSQSNREPIEIVSRDTVYVDQTDTVPKEVAPEKVVKYIKVPVSLQQNGDSIPQEQPVASSPDSMVVPIVQRTYSDDSTYTAWVSGAKIGTVSPRLDSIHVRQRTIIETITSKPPNRRWHIGINVGYGIGTNDRTLQPFIGVGIQYNLY